MARMDHGYSMNRDQIDLIPEYGRSTINDVKLTLCITPTTTREEYINMMRVLFCGKGRVPVTCYGGQMELFLLLESLPLSTRCRIYPFSLYRILSQYSFESGFKLYPYNLSVNIHYTREMELVLLRSGMDATARSQYCAKKAREALAKYRFGEGFSLEASCIQKVVVTVLNRIYERHGTEMFFSGVNDARTLLPVTEMIQRLPLPQRIIRAVAQTVLGTLRPGFGRVVFHCAECPLYQIFVHYAHDGYVGITMPPPHSVMDM